ncbi:hypothetical protein [Salinarimonas ramus]|uniref:HipA N-terminal subdomain 1 domain-containing protein n=1 Tax=Salinarimonas ramus TaxID=690164 RepID=A0A917V6Y7_9HYPH|nr:hypothetical protein [Salinarimonas ramus]GGK46140.1 hypothetical protein GCM10011322_36550 [Salinarimonas ramus]
MSEADVLEVLLHGARVGTLTRLPGDRTLLAFDRAYVEDPERPTLGLGGVPRDLAGGEGAPAVVARRRHGNRPARGDVGARSGVRVSAQAEAGRDAVTHVSGTGSFRHALAEQVESGAARGMR